MVKEVKGNLLDADAEALVNTVNCVGVMGKGVALQFKQAFPRNFSVYEQACKKGDVLPGRMFVYRTETLHKPRFIINFPTKRHWRGKSRMRDIETGLRDLIETIRAEKIHSIALPPLGCGNGGLDWNQVRSKIREAFLQLPDVEVFLYAPVGAPAAKEMRVATSRPNMTPGRAALLGVMGAYTLPGYCLTLLEIQKLAYFLQVAGEPLKLQFDKGEYGPYTETLHHVLQRMEGHFIRGYGDRSRSISIVIFTGALTEAERVLEEKQDTRQRLERVKELIDGFETPYGMELLSSVHWVAREGGLAGLEDGPQVVERIFEWNEHKRSTFKEKHILVAWKQLLEQGWLSE